ncbi:visual pigment-like receptor peropsin isoform X1 [Biomphalaria glabrata]|uniref:Visual pigment-like receptor peropsin isoform X1 n=1 Tax=Biomphalaria glabrata TaxID=6526 RepID=A0A9W3A5R7_BIOGL|nr:visual pigment-like receptor peropsin isoform X1 [Biomphalaria glabrata]
MTLLQSSKAAGGPRSVLTDATTIGSVVTTDMLADNATEGRHFIPLSDAGFTFIACMLGFTFVVGSFSNGLCLFVFIRNRRLRSPTNVFVMALNLVDFLMCFTGIPMAMTSAWNHKWIWGDAMCDFEAFLVYFLGMASMYVLMAIAFDRYIAISKPLLGTKITKSIAYVSCAGCYFLGFIWAIPPAFGWNEFGLEGAGISCSVVWENPDPLYMSYIWAIFFFCFIIPLGIMVYSYWGVLATLRNLNKNSVWDMNSRVARKNLAIEKKMFKTAVLIVASYWICWMPYTVVSFISAFIGSEIIPPLFATIPPVIAKCQGIFNPLILVTRHKAFQKAFFATFVVQRKRKQRTDYSMRVIEASSIL